MSDHHVLKDFPFFKKLSEEDMTSLFESLKERRFEADTDIISDGEKGREMFILLEGKVDIIRSTLYGEKFVCASLDDSMKPVFGEMAMIDEDKRSATVHAVTSCRTLSIDDRAFNAYVEAHPKAGVELLRYISVNLVRNMRLENENLNLVFQALIEEIESN
ncbi:MAG: cyclic nucleotide-binding domain-containing protein [Lachnospiraceae bacterium]|nr:cyclic nucleotide-binding domain-containing protein [Lachnospiraceae bacterium]